MLKRQFQRQSYLAVAFPELFWWLRLSSVQASQLATTQARCKAEQEETARVVAVHARMEEEYRLALSSADEDRARLEEAIASLESQLADERHAQAIR